MTQPSRINTYTAVKATSSSGITSKGIAAPVGAGSNRYSLIFVAWNSAVARTVNSITRDGQSYSPLTGTLYTSVLAGAEAVQLWGLANPNASPSSDVATTTWSGSVIDHYIMGVTLQDVASVEGGTGYSTQTTDPIVLTSTQPTSAEKIQFGGLIIAETSTAFSAVSPTTVVDKQSLAGALAGLGGAGFFERVLSGASQTLSIDTSGNAYDANTIVLVGTSSATLVELTAASFGATAQSISPKAKATFTAASFAFSAKSLATRVRNTLTTASFASSAKSLTLRAVNTLTAASFVSTAQSIELKLKATLTAASMVMNALEIDVANSTTQVIELTLATFTIAPAEVRAQLRMELSAAQMSITAGNVSVTQLIYLTVKAVEMVAQDLTLRARNTLTSATSAMTGLAVTAWSTITLTTAEMALTAQELTNRLKVYLTTAEMQMRGMAITFVTDAVAAVVNRVRISYSRFRQLLKSRKY